MILCLCFPGTSGPLCPLSFGAQPELGGPDGHHPTCIALQQKSTRSTTAPAQPPVPYPQTKTHPWVPPAGHPSAIPVLPACSFAGRSGSRPLKLREWMHNPDQARWTWGTQWFNNLFRQRKKAVAGHHGIWRADGFWQSTGLNDSRQGRQAGSRRRMSDQQQKAGNLRAAGRYLKNLRCSSLRWPRWSITMTGTKPWNERTPTPR